MIAAPRHAPAAGLRRFGLLALVLAVLAGLLGMHVFVGAHGAHASATPSATGAQAVPADAAASAHSTSVHSTSVHSAAGHSAAAQMASGHSRPAVHHETSGPPSCGCGGACGEQQTAHTSCMPAPSGTSLSAPTPGTTLLAVQPRITTATRPASAYSYLPATPTPNELSISRT